MKLRLAGVKVVSNEERLASEDWAQLYVHINSVSVNDSPNIIYNVSEKISELFNCTRSPRDSIFGTTWTKSGLGMCSNEEFQEVARKSVKDYTDEFINDYLTANPKK